MAEIRVQKKKSKFIPWILTLIILVLVAWIVYSMFFKKENSMPLNGYIIQQIKG